VTAEILVVGASHKTAPIELREKLALPAGRASRVLSELTGHDAVQEAAALSTCNRTELYLVTTEPAEAES
jgi:glutamyl-tRNA reductase